jgi:hypothetical protein
MLFGKIQRCADGIIKFAHFTHSAGQIVIVGAVVNVAALDHLKKALGVFGKSFGGISGHIAQYMPLLRYGWPIR